MRRARPRTRLVAAVRTVGAAAVTAGRRRCSSGRPGRRRAGPAHRRPLRAHPDRRPGPGRRRRGTAPDGSTVGGERARHPRHGRRPTALPPLPDGLAASGWLVADAGSGEVLAARDPHGRYYPASTLKTLTLLTLAPRLDPAQVVPATVEDENIEGSRVGMVEGGQYPVSLLFQALVLQSGNDAANALARTAGGMAATVEAMNETAEAIGAFDTVAGTPSGLDVAGQSSSPYDLALIFRALLDDPATAAILTTPDGADAAGGATAPPATRSRTRTRC